jgi:hypothetical protein
VSHWLPLLLQAQKAIDELSLFFFNPTVGMRLIEDSHLEAAFGAVGVTLPSRTTLSGTLLDKQYTVYNHLQHCPELQHCDHGSKYWAPGGLCMCFYCAVLWALRISFLPTKMSHLA